MARKPVQKNVNSTPFNLGHKTVLDGSKQSSWGNWQALSQKKCLFPSLAGDKKCMVYWATRYLYEEVEGVQSPHTLEAKTRDLRGFVFYFLDLNGHTRLGDWFPRDTRQYLLWLEKNGKAPSTSNRNLATLSKFARWCNDQPDTPIRTNPIRNIRALAIDVAPAKSLSNRDMYALFKASDNLIATKARIDSRPHRNKAILALLYYTGIRASELLNLNLYQYDGMHLNNVIRKGNRRSRIYIALDCRLILDKYFKKERFVDDPGEKLYPMFINPKVYGAGRIQRQPLNYILQTLANEASKNRNARLKLTPHMLRHTFAYNIRARTGSDTETANALGHSTLEYVGRYVKETEEKRQSVMDSLSDFS